MHDNALVCLVPSCERQPFRTDYGFRRHWKNLHSKTIELFKCPVSDKCNALKTQAKLREHLAFWHSREEKEARENARSCETIFRPNRNYISPGNLKPLAGNVLEKLKQKSSKPSACPSKSAPDQPSSTREVKESSTDNLPDNSASADSIAEPCRRIPKTRIELIQLIEKARRKQDYWEQIEYEAKEELKRVEYREVADKLEILRKQITDEIAKSKALQERVDAEQALREEAQAKVKELEGNIKKKQSAKMDKLMTLFKKAIEEE